MPKLSEVTGQAPARLKLSQVMGQPQQRVAPGQPQTTTLSDIPGVSVEDFNRNVQAIQGGGSAADRLAEAKRQEYEQRRRTMQSYPAPARAGIGFAGKMNNTAVGIGQLLGLTDEAGVARERARYGHIADDTAYQVGGLLGEAALVAVPSGQVARLATLPQRIAAGTAVGGAYGAIQPVAEGESRTANVATHGAAGAGGEVLGQGFRYAGRALAPEIRAIADAARAKGIELTPSQLTNSKWLSYAQAMLRNTPFTGAQSKAQAQHQQFMRAISKSFGADADVLTDDVMRDARRRLSAGFEDVYNRNTVDVGEQGLRRLASTENEAAADLVTGDAQVVRNQVDRILAEMSDTGTLTGQKYQALRSKLMKAEGNDRLGTAVKEVRRVLDDLANTSVGAEDAAALQSLRGQWANLRTTEDLLKQVAGATGNIRPAAVWPAIRNGSTQEMRDLGRIGQLIKEPPSSGTAERLMASSAWNPVNWPYYALGGGVGATLGRGLNSNMLANFIASDFRPAAANRLAQLAGPAAIVSGPAMAKGKKD